ncbi:MAG: hypothetical protein JSW55_09405, partial [Chloroflexota bacterium]
AGLHRDGDRKDKVRAGAGAVIGDDRAVAGDRVHPEHSRPENIYHDQITRGLHRNAERNSQNRAGAVAAIAHDRAIAGDRVHPDLDYARWVAGEVESIFAKKISSSRPEADTDHGLAILKHRSGAISHVEGSWAYPPPTFWTRFEMAGDNGWLDHDSERTAAIDLRLQQAADEEIPDVPLPSNPLDEDPYTTEIKAFYDSVVNDAPIAVSGADGLAALQLALAAIESADSGRPVTLMPLW